MIGRELKILPWICIRSRPEVEGSGGSGGGAHERREAVVP
jgi:hypothetical protein